MSAYLFGLALVPSSFDWQRDAVSVYTDYFGFFALAALLYLPVVFGLQRWMQNRLPIDLRGIVLWWEVSLALFSIVGAMHVVPIVIDSIARSGLAASVCSTDFQTDRRSFWGFLFSVSKVFEFGDTVFLVLRKKDLVVLQYYHHLATMVYCWYGTVVISKMNNTNPYFAAMNLCVHSVMYTWYAATRTGWRSPKWMMICITLLQSMQMLIGVAIVYIASVARPGTDCGRWARDDPLSLYAAYCMYVSYFVLFAKMFVEKYCCAKRKTKDAKKILHPDAKKSS